ncbi:hypothetical protein ACIBP6_09165 [Nonomuraea terrae]|uniref:hypothetical protein n=1 Tax=Nonomuraea terrae TaxID=2530383 RepID=UPI0037A39523
MPNEHHHTEPLPMIAFEPQSTAVSVDQSGRRRRLIILGSIAGTLALFGLLVVVVGGLFSNTTQAVSGRPGGQPGGPAATASPDRSSPTPTRRTTQAGRPPMATQTLVRSPSPTADRRRTSTAQPTRAQTQRDPVQSRTRAPGESPESEQPIADPRGTTSAEPSREPTRGESTASAPTAEPAPTRRDRPGRGIPPGHDPNRQKGPKG